MITMLFGDRAFDYDRDGARWTSDQYPLEAEVLTAASRLVQLESYAPDPAYTRAVLLAQDMRATLRFTGEDAAEPVTEPAVAY